MITKKRITEEEEQTTSNRPIKAKTLPKEVVSMLNDRIKDEFTAHYFYMSAGNWCNVKGYEKAGSFFLNESLQELEHSKGLQDYLVQWNLMPTIPSVETKHTFSGLVDIINKAYTLEYNLYLKYNENSKSILVKDTATFDFLQKYRQIQNDSVKEYSDLLNVLDSIDTNNKFDLLYFENNYFK